MRLRLLFAALLVAMQALPPGAAPARADHPIRVSGTGAAMEYRSAMAARFADSVPGAHIHVIEGLGSSGSIRAILDGALDVAVSGRPLRPGETGKGLVAVPLLETPFGFFTSRKAPVGVEAERLPRLYAEPHCNCSTFGNALVRVVLRPEAESDTKVAAEYFPGLGEAMQVARKLPGVPVAQTDQDNAALAERLVDSLTTGTLLQMLSERRNLRPLRIDGVEPTLEAMRSGAYPYTKTLYLIHRDPAGEAVERFTAFLFSDEAAEITEALGAMIVR